MEDRVALFASCAIQLLESESEKESDDDAFVLSALLTEKNQRKTPKITHYVENVVPLYDNTSFKRMFRMTRETCNIIANYLSQCHELQTHGLGKEPVPIEKQLLMFLWYVGSLDTINKIADRFGVSESTVIVSRNKILKAINENLLVKFVKWPNVLTLPVEADKFAQRNGFPGIVGALDVTHIRIKAPKDHPQSNVNRKHFHSLQLQAVCASDMTFTHVTTGFPGSVHDARVLRQSDLWSNGLRMCNMTYHIIADAAYPLRRWLLTPYRDNGHLNDNEKKYNRYLSSCRVIIERSFAVLKGRFRRLQFLDTCSVETAVEVIMASCVLHNICMFNKEEVEEYIQYIDDGNFGQMALPFIQENEAEGVLKRSNITRNLQ